MSRSKPYPRLIWLALILLVTQSVLSVSHVHAPHEAAWQTHGVDGEVDRSSSPGGPAAPHEGDADLSCALCATLHQVHALPAMGSSVPAFVPAPARFMPHEDERRAQAHGRAAFRARAPPVTFEA